LAITNTCYELFYSLNTLLNVIQQPFYKILDLCYAMGMEARDFRSIGVGGAQAVRNPAGRARGTAQSSAASLFGAQQQTVRPWLKRARGVPDLVA
jgi:hypothetical protein